MKRSIRRPCAEPLAVAVSVWLFACVISGSSVLAQVPLGPEFLVGSLTEEYQGGMSVAYNSAGDALITWESPLPPREEPGFWFGVLARIIPASGQRLGSQIVVRASDKGNIYGRTLAAWQPNSSFLVGWNEFGKGIMVQSYDAAGHRQGPGTAIGPLQFPNQSLREVDLAALPSGGFVALWTGSSAEPNTVVLYARKLNPTGQPAGPVVGIVSSHDESFFPWSVAASPNGSLLVLWSAADSLGRGIAGQLFSESLEPLGDPFQINTTEEGEQVLASAVPLSPRYGTERGYAVVWANEGHHYEISGRFVSPEGEPDFPPDFRVSSQSYATAPAVASDPKGNFVVVWLGTYRGGPRLVIWGQLFHRNAEPIGEPFIINDSQDWVNDADLHLAFGPAGIFTVAWKMYTSGIYPSGNRIGVFARQFVASPGAEPCVLEGEKLRCDAGRTGGRAEITLNVGASSGETLLAGDIDGDRRDDLCFHKKITFRCDLDHDGVMEHQIRFGTGRPSETPLLGDLDGDGRDDPCIREGRSIRCDTRHDGGPPDRFISIELADGVPFFTSNGLCIYRAGHFICEREDIAFGRPGDTPLFADFDGDGRDDPCVFRNGRFLCDTARDGGEAEGVLAFGSPGSVPLLANLDGI